MYKTAKELHVGIRYQVNSTIWVVDQIKIKNNGAIVFATKDDGSFSYSVATQADSPVFKTI